MNPSQPRIRPLLESIIHHRSLHPTFQAIACLQNQTIYGYEGLIRGPKQTPLHSPTMLFEAAQRCGLLSELDLLCREMLLQQFARLNLQGRLFLNMDPRTLIQEEQQETLPRLLKETGIDGSRLVIEITENHPIEDIPRMRKILEQLGHWGIRYALDDLGTGYSGLKVWSQLKPDMVKIDRHFIHNVDEDPTKQQFIRTILEMATAMGSEVITEGVETVEEYAILRKLGVKLVQGYYFARPEAAPPSELSSSLFRQECRPLEDLEAPTIESLLRPAVSVAEHTTVMAVGEMFTDMPELESIVVVHDDEVLGIVLKKDFMNVYAILYGKELYGREPIMKFMKKNILKMDKNLSLEDASYRLTTSLDLYTEEFLLLENGKLLGRGLLIDLLHEITTVRVRLARYANPLTMLPGNVPIQRQLQALIQTNQEFTICYFDLDNFKPFNDIFGFSKGDEAILLVAELLQENTDPGKTFIGHIGGDDFVLIFWDQAWLDTVHSILEQFDRRVTSFYHGKSESPILAKDRQGHLCSYSRMSLSVGAVILDGRQQQLQDLDLSEEAAIAKHHAKSQKGSSLHIHRPHVRPQPLSPGKVLQAA